MASTRLPPLDLPDLKQINDPLHPANIAIEEKMRKLEQEIERRRWLMQTGPYVTDHTATTDSYHIQNLLSVILQRLEAIEKRLEAEDEFVRQMRLAAMSKEETKDESD